MMKAAILKEYGTPSYGEFDPPRSTRGQVVVDVSAAAISRFDIAFSAGTLLRKPAMLPSVAGIEGVGHLPDGRLVYFSDPIAPFGSMAEQSLVSSDSFIEVPDGVDEAVAAVLANSGLAAWLPLSWRAKLQPGETVMVLGATGVVGQLAVQSAKLLGAGKVIAVGRDDAKLIKTKALGADATINLTSTTGFNDCVREIAPNGADIIVDYLWGQPALDAIQASAIGARLVQIGTTSSEYLSLSGALIRRKNLTIMGFANYHAVEERIIAYQEICKLARDGKLSLEFERVPLSEIKSAWEMQRAGEVKRIVIVP